MKRFFTDLLYAIPMAIGLVLTIFCVVNAIASPDDGEKSLTALVSGIVGIPLLYASTIAILRRGVQNSRNLGGPVEAADKL
jgi:predicted permease